MTTGQTVYVVNAKTNSVDEWVYHYTVRANKTTLVFLTHGKKSCFIPINCVFDTYEKAVAVANKRV